MQQPPRGGTWVGVSLGWVPWDGPLGVGFCAGLLSVPQNRARFSYSGFGRSYIIKFENDSNDYLNL
ncbi:hypothetical protein V1477_020462 [Vespula maculifrons]|uniref:Uncharacterized protein n=1 Tax=Vespula maculifrons TaxID=7453 RepID=A0ABD2AMU4_VESMC